MDRKGCVQIETKHPRNKDLVSTLSALDSERENWVGEGKREKERKKIKT